MRCDASNDMRVEECKTCSLYAHLHNLVIRDPKVKRAEITDKLSSWSIFSYWFFTNDSARCFSWINESSASCSCSFYSLHINNFSDIDFQRRPSTLQHLFVLPPSKSSYFSQKWFFTASSSENIIFHLIRLNWQLERRIDKIMINWLDVIHNPP